MIPRRGFLAGLGALLAAPAIIRTPGLLMPVRVAPVWFGVDMAGTPSIPRIVVVQTQPLFRTRNLVMEMWLEAMRRDGATIERRDGSADTFAGLTATSIFFDEAGDITNETRTDVEVAKMRRLG